MSRVISILIVLGLFLILLMQWIGWSATVYGPELGAEVEPSRPKAPEAMAPEALARLESDVSKESYASILEHPLFRPDRKPEPPEEEDAESEPPNETKEDLNAADLSAVLITPTIVSAWVKDPSKPRLQRLRIGDDFLGWSVQEILEDRVVLERQGEQDTLILRDYSKAPLAPQPRKAPEPTPRRPVRPPPPLKK